MFRNFLTSTDLKRHEPKFADWIKNYTTSPADQFYLASDEVQTSLRTIGKDSRLVMTPLYLSSSTAPYRDTITASVISSAIEEQRSNRVHRFVIDKYSCTQTGTNTITLEGSMDNVNWNTEITITLTSNAEILSDKFENEWKYYRYSVSKGTTLSLVASIYLVETSFDNLIAYWTLAKIANFLSVISGDSFEKKQIEYEKKFIDLLERIRFAYDYDQSETITESEEANNTIFRIKL